MAGCGGPGPSVASAPPAPTDVPAGPGDTGVPAALGLTAEASAFSPAMLVGPAGRPFTITLRNRDEGVPHNVAIRAGVPVGSVARGTPDLYVDEIFPGRATRTYDVPALRAGAYTLACQVHPNMVTTLELR